MPSKSPEQRRFMAAVANNPAFAKKVGVPASVGKEFSRADKAKGYSTRAGINNPNTAHGKLDMPFHSVKSNAKGGEMKSSKDKMMAMMQKKKAPAAASKGAMPGMGGPAGMKHGDTASSRADGIAQRGKTKGKMMRKGGKVC